MNVRAIALYIGHILRLEGLVMIPAAGIAFYYNEPSCAFAFLIMVLLLQVVGILLIQQKREIGRIYAREGYVTVALSWVALSFFGSFPFFLSGAIANPIDCWFETVSGFTTTSASILVDIEALPKSLLFWRSFIQWLGGMGMLVFMLAVVPHNYGQGETLHLLRAEAPGPAVGKLSPTIRATTRILYGIYIILTLIQIIFLVLGGMSLFDSVIHALSTAGTGGFSSKNNSIAAYDSPYIHIVIGVFMVLFSINFNIFYLILLGKIGMAFKNEEFRAYLAIILAAVVIIAFNIMSMYQSVGKALLDAFFQVVSTISTTGFFTADYNKWPLLSRCILVGLMMTGASASLTSGGIKIMRLLILGKAVKSELLTMAHPRAVRPPRMDGKRIDYSVINGTYAFITVYAIICIISIGIISLDNLSMDTTVTAVLASINNIGPGLDIVGPMRNYHVLSPMAKMVLSFNMLLGRLELFPVLLLFSKENWRQTLMH